MAPLPGNNTGVLYVDYSVGGFGHTLQVRYADGSSPAAAMNVVANFLSALTPEIRLITIEGARFRGDGGVVTQPIAWTGAPSYGAGAADPSHSAWYIDFIGRSSGGRRVRLSVFGAQDLIDLGENDYRAPTSGAFGAARDVLVAASDIIVAIDNLAPNWYPYVNLGVNAYWRNRIR